MSELTLHLVRHGETTFNAERRIQGQMHEVPLSARGREQAREMAEKLRACTAGALFSSDLLRAMETAQAISQTVGLPVQPEPALREKHFGVTQGQLYADVAEVVHEWWLRHDDRIDGGETNREMYHRVGGYLDALRAAPPCDEIILVCHGGTLNMALAHLAGTPLDDMEWRRIENCAVEKVRVPRL